MENNTDQKNLEFLINKSRELLQEQIKSYESTNTKSGVLLSIFALFIPIVITYVSSAETIWIFKLLSVIPLATLICALIKFLRVLTPKGLDHGFNFDRFEELLKVPYRDLLLYEIGANRSSFIDNSRIVVTQLKNFKVGIKLIFFGSFILAILVTTIALYPNNEKDKITQKPIFKNKTLYKDTLIKSDMSNNNSGSSSNSSSQVNQGQQGVTSPRI